MMKKTNKTEGLHIVSDRKKVSKYRAVKVEYDDKKFDSKAEVKRYIELTNLQKMGLITGLKCQDRFQLMPAQKDKDGNLLFRRVSYVADFTYTRKDGTYVVEDVKGFKTPVYKLKKALFYYMYGYEITEVTVK